MSPPFHESNQNTVDVRDALETLAIHGDFTALVSGFFQKYSPDSEAFGTLCDALDYQILQDLRFLPPPPMTAFKIPSWGSVCGKDWKYHPFRHTPLFWWRMAYEPDVTRMIQTVCSPEYAGHKAALSFASTFLIALSQSLPNCPSLPFKLGGRTIEVLAEEKTSEEKRLDLLFISGKTCVAIEAKFDAAADNPFELYDEYLDAKGYTNPLKVILGSHRVEQKGWVFAHWADVLRHWENLLFFADVPHRCAEDFSRLRATIWAKL